MSSFWIYGGLFLDVKTKVKLIDRFIDNIPKGWNVYCDHMTSIFYTNEKGNEDIVKFLDNNKGKKFPLEIVSIGVDEYVVALGVKTNVPSTNKIKHITLAVAPGHKPFESNNIKHWKELTDKHKIKIKGTVNI